jgi:hypothetical protein
MVRPVGLTDYSICGSLRIDMVRSRVSRVCVGLVYVKGDGIVVARERALGAFLADERFGPGAVSWFRGWRTICRIVVRLPCGVGVEEVLPNPGRERFCHRRPAT